MDQANNIPAELLEALDPTPEPPETIRLSRTAWLDLIRLGRCEYDQYMYVWTAEGVTRIHDWWIGHPERWRHFEDVIRFVED